MFSETQLPRERISSKETTSQESEPLKDAASLNVGEELVHVALQQKLQLDSITVKSAPLSEECMHEQSRQLDCKPVSRCVADLSGRPYFETMYISCSDTTFYIRISLSSRRSPCQEVPVVVEHGHLLGRSHVPQSSFGEINAEITASRSSSVPSKIEARRHAFDKLQDHDDPLKHKEEAVMASLQCNADSLHAALLELEGGDDSLHESCDERDEDLYESDDRPMCSPGLFSVTPTSLPNHNEMPSVASSACSVSSIRTVPHSISEQVSVASVPSAPVLSLKAWISFRFVFAAVVFLSVPSGISEQHTLVTEGSSPDSRCTCSGSSRLARGCRRVGIRNFRLDFGAPRARR